MLNNIRYNTTLYHQSEESIPEVNLLFDTKRYVMNEVAKSYDTKRRVGLSVDNNFDTFRVLNSPPSISDVYVEDDMLYATIFEPDGDRIKYRIIINDNVVFESDLVNTTKIT